MTLEVILARLRHYLPVMLGVVLGLIVLGLSERSIEIQQQSAQLSLDFEVQNDLASVRSRIEQELNILLYKTLGISAYLQANKGVVENREIEGVLEATYQNSAHIRNFGLARGTVIQWVYPRSGNEAALGKDYRDIPVQWDQVQRAMSVKEGILVGPVNLIQGGQGLIFRFPINVNGAYWGILSTVIDVESFLQEIASNRIFAHGDVAIRTKQAGEPVTLMFGAESVFAHKNAQTVDVFVPGGFWEIALTTYRQPNVPLLHARRLMGWCVAMLLGFGLSTILFQRRELSRLAMVDQLTGFANRRQFDLLLERFCEKYNRRNAGRFTILYVDLDNFKELNDVHGHRAGDYFLVDLAERTKAVIRGGDVMARWGGDEFAIILDNPTLESVSLVVERVRQTTEQPVVWQGMNLSLGASIGVVHYPEDGATPEELISTADKKMYANKRFRKKRLASMAEGPATRFDAG